MNPTPAPQPDLVDPAPARRAWVGLLAFALLAAIGLGVDLYVKYAAFDRLLLAPVERSPVTGRVLPLVSDEIRFLPNWLHFRVTVNEGAVFGWGQGQRWLFVVVSFVAIAFLSALSWRDRRWFNQLTLGLLLAGVLGNLYDRWYYGYVRDMLYALPGQLWGDWALFRWVLPARIEGLEMFPWIFNLADVFLCTGVALMLVQSFWPTPSAKQ